MDTQVFNSEPIDTPLIEHATMTLASRAGINTAQTQVIHLAGENAIAIRRFDRVPGRRIHSIKILGAEISKIPQPDAK